MEPLVLAHLLFRDHFVTPARAIVSTIENTISTELHYAQNTMNFTKEEILVLPTHFCIK